MISIAMELMKEAELFFLDEPTSGLDSASSLLVIRFLHFLASKGVTVCATIHQPRIEIFKLIDRLLLLAPGGRVAYFIRTPYRKLAALLPENEVFNVLFSTALV